MRTITICNIKYEIDCNAFTYVKFREKFKRGIFDDIKILQAFLTKQVMLANELKEENKDVDDATIINSLSKLMLDDIDLFVEAATRIAYILIYTANNKVKEYEDWLKNITTIRTNDEWIAEVTEFAVNCFC